MPVKDLKKYQTLSKLIDNSFGRSSTVKSGTQSVKLKMVDDTMMTATYLMIVNFGSENVMREMMRRYTSQGLSMIEAALAEVQDQYKEETGSKVVLKPDLNSTRDSVEFLSYSMYNPRRTAYFRLECVINVH